MAGSVTLSVEVELGWGVHDIGTYDRLSPDGSTERAYLRRLLARCEELDLPISFDVVGHLFLAECDGHHEGPYPPGWFDEDPGTGPESDGRFYAPDVVEAIEASPVAHEICTHTFSHTLGTMPDETLAADLEAAQRVHERHLGERTVSLVPPRHQQWDADLLADAGIEIARYGVDTGDKSAVNRARELLAGPLPTWEPELVDGVVETYCTTYPSLVSPAIVSGRQRRKHPVFRAVPLTVRQRLHGRSLRRAVDRVADGGGNVNLWCHLFDLSNERQWPPLSRFLGDLAARRDAGDVDVLTLEGLNERVRSGQLVQA